MLEPRADHRIRCEDALRPLPSRLKREAVSIGITRIENLDPSDWLSYLRYVDARASESRSLGRGIADEERRIGLSGA